jgi:hypothetical protein
MKLTKETLKRIIKEEMMQVMHEMDSEQTNDLPEPLKELQHRLEAINGDFTNFKIERNGDTLDVEYESTDPNSQFRGDERGIIASPSTEKGEPQVNIDGNEMTIEKAVAFLNGEI